MPMQQAPRLRLILLCSDPDATKVYTVLDGSHKVRALPQFTLDPGRYSGPEAQANELLQLSDEQNICQFQQIGTSFENGRIIINLMALVADRTRLDIPDSDYGQGDWWPLFGLFPWEDWRKGCPLAVSQHLLPALYRACRQAKDNPGENCRKIAALFADDGQSFAPQNLPERFTALYEAGLLPEALRDRSGATVSVRRHHVQIYGQIMSADDRQILANSLAGLRRDLQLRPVMAALLHHRFSLGRLQRAIENLIGVSLHTQNFRRDMKRTRLLEATNSKKTGRNGRPVQLYQFKSDLDLNTSIIPMPMPRIRPTPQPSGS